MRKGGRTYLALKREHAMDVEVGATVAAEVHGADQGGQTPRSGGGGAEGLPVLPGKATEALSDPGR